MNEPKVWLITGATSGFGRALTEAAIAAGDTVVAAVRRPEALDALVAAHPDQVDPVRLDVTDAARAQDVNFARDIQPILSDKCYHCHGPDAGSRKADLRLEVLDPKLGPFVERDGYHIVKPESSLTTEGKPPLPAMTGLPANFSGGWKTRRTDSRLYLRAQ